MCSECRSFSGDIMIYPDLCLAWCYNCKTPIEWRVVKDFLDTEQAKTQIRNNSRKRHRQRKEAQERAAKAQDKLF